MPGSPLVAERTVELLRGDPRVDLTIVPALSFLDLAWERLGLDPLGAGVRLVDAEQFAQQYTAEGGPHLVAQCWSQALLSEIKLSAFSDDDLVAPDVVLLSHLGLADEQVVHVGWWDLDRTLQARPPDLPLHPGGGGTRRVGPGGGPPRGAGGDPAGRMSMGPGADTRVPHAAPARGVL